VDDAPMYYCDSKTKRTELKQDWMNKVTADDPQYWETETQICVGKQQTFKANIGIVKQRFNQTGGLFVLNFLLKCFGFFTLVCCKCVD
uniref:MHC class I-like antigen recognition-like domain-containing protein n=1 Tax=Seriola dumerili TaxID=41447 RepID=A0A3B4U6N5_SERDU